MFSTPLDDHSAYSSIDPSAMGSHLRNLPQQCRHAMAEAKSFSLPQDYSDIDKVVVLGMGGSAIGADLARALLTYKSSVAFYLHRDYGVPAFIDRRTLVVASSYSGMTEETLDGFNKALGIDCRKIVITTGGRLLEIARQHGIPAFVFNYKSQPRAALGYSLFPMLAILQKVGIMTFDDADICETFSLMENLSSRLREDVPTHANRAKYLASQLFRRFPIIYGAGLLSPVAYRWKTQINENAKTTAISETVPELCHNSVAGLGLPAEITRKCFALILQAPSLHKRHLARYVPVRELLQQSGIPYETLDAEGRSELSHMMSLVMIGDWTSYYLAILNGVDPTPIPFIDFLKERLRQS